MSQSKVGSLLEALAHTGIGFIISILISLVIYPLFGHAFTLAENVGITIIFTVASIIRGYIIRRWFNDRIHNAAMKLARDK